MDCPQDLSDPLSLETRRGWLLAAASGLLTSACGGGGSSAPAPAPAPIPTLPRPPVVPVNGPSWPGFAGNAQHTAVGAIAAQRMDGIYWYTPVDLAPTLSPTGALLTHYGSPVITRRDTVIVPVKTAAAGGFRVEARVGATGDLVWALNSSYLLPPHRWVPSFNPALTQDGRVWMPASGGRVMVRSNAGDPGDPGATLSTLTFYGDAAYNAAPAAFDATVFINTPLTSDAAGNVYFGYVVTGANPAGLTGGGIARIAANDTMSFVRVIDAVTIPGPTKTATNAAPALSNDGSALYVLVNNVPPANVRPSGRLLRLNATTLATLSDRALLDPASGLPSRISDDATSSPLVAPDGDVYIGVLEAPDQSHKFRGWMLHFDAALTQTKTPGSFGWDNTPSIVPVAVMGGTYTGPSSYLLLTKYNNYAGLGDGLNRIAIIDPNQTQADPHSTPAVTVMREIITQLGPTLDPAAPPNGRKEWCVNTAAVDPATNAVLINSEDGILYRWHLPSNTFTQQVTLNAGLFQSYTPTALGPDGRIYSINNATLHSVGQL